MGSHRAAPSPTRYPRAAASAALLFIVMGLLTVTPAAAATGTYVRLAQLTQDTAGAELVFSSVSDPQRSVTIPGISYGGLSEYRLIQPGDYVVGMQPVGSAGPPLVSMTLNATAGNSYTVAAVGSKTREGLTVFADDLTPPDADHAKVRVINAAPPAPRLDVRGPAGEPYALGLPCGQASGYRMVPAGPTMLTVGPSGGPSVDLPITVAPNQVVSVVLVTRNGGVAAEVDGGGPAAGNGGGPAAGNGGGPAAGNGGGAVGGNGGVAAEVRVDAGGPASMPPGPIDAGFGGAAPGQPGGATGMTVFGVLAAMAAGLSVYLSRRTRGARPRSC